MPIRRHHSGEPLTRTARLSQQALASPDPDRGPSIPAPPFSKPVEQPLGQQPGLIHVRLLRHCSRQGMPGAHPSSQVAGI